jgi:hypothetical protein
LQSCVRFTVYSAGRWLINRTSLLQRRTRDGVHPHVAYAAQASGLSREVGIGGRGHDDADLLEVVPHDRTELSEACGKPRASSAFAGGEDDVRFRCGKGLA